MALPGTGGPGVTAHPRNAVPRLEDDTTGPGMEVNQVGEAESLIRSRCLADTGTPRAYRSPLFITFRTGAGQNRYSWIPRAHC